MERVRDLNPLLFARERLGFEADDGQRTVIGTDARRVLLCCSRQWGKSTTAAILAAHRAYCLDRSLVICVSPTLRQSGELVRKVREFLIGLGEKARGDGTNSLSILLENGSRVVGVPAKSATLRGYGGVNLLIIDEAAQVADEVYRTVRPMLATSGGRLMLLSTPFGQRGFFWKEWSEGGERWLRVEVKATECSRIPAEFLEEERTVMGEEWFAQEYLCSFVGMENGVFREEWLAAAEREGLPFRRLLA